MSVQFHGKGEGTLLFERIVSDGIAHNSYLVGSGGKAAVIDPRRDCDIYLEIAGRNELLITHIFETHRNEDYAIGSLDLQKTVRSRDLSWGTDGVYLWESGSGGGFIYPGIAGDIGS